MLFLINKKSAQKSHAGKSKQKSARSLERKTENNYYFPFLSNLLGIEMNHEQP